MNSEQLVAALESCSLPPSEFSHERHVQVAWHYLQRLPRDEAAQRFADSLRAYVRHVGAEGKFHLTMTIALVHLIAARRLHPGQDWPAFRQDHPDLFNSWRRLLDCHYSTEALERGRDLLVEADREPLS